MWEREGVRKMKFSNAFQVAAERSLGERLRYNFLREVDMKKLLLLTCFFFWGWVPIGAAQNLSGTYILQSPNATLTLVINQDSQGNIKGALTSTTGVKFQVMGMIQDGVGVGTCTSDQGGSYFEAHPKGNQLLLALIEPDANQKPDYNKVRELMFTKKSGAIPGPQAPQASPGQQGGQYQAGQPASPEGGGSAALSRDEVGDANWGFKFNLPKGWKVEKGPKGAVMAHDTIPGMIWVFPHTSSSLQEIRAQLHQGLDEEDIKLRLTSQVQSLSSNALAGTYSGIYQGQQVTARGIGTFSPNGGGALIIAMTVPDKFGPNLTNTADIVAKSMQYFRASSGSAGMGGIGGGGGPSGPGDPLMRQMAGVYYSFSSAGLSYSGGTETKVVMCPDGTYYSGSESSYSAGAGTSGAWGAAGQRGDRGTWKVRGNVNEGILTTMGPDGKPTEYRYKRCGGDCIYIGNKKFAVSTPANCP